MSLINKMLMELEERRSEGEVFGALQDQLRAARERRQKQTPWKAVVLVLAILLAGLIVWIWHQRTMYSAAIPASAEQALYQLKISTDLSRLPVMANEPPIENPQIGQAFAPLIDENPLQSDNNAEANRNTPGTEKYAAVLEARPVEPKPMSATASTGIKNANDLLMPVDAASASIASKTDRSAPKLVVAAESAKESGSKAELPQVKAEKALVGSELKRQSDTDIALPVTKQVKELTLQQLAENEYRRATGLIQQGRTVDAIFALEQALQTDPQHVAALQALVGLLIQGKRHDEAIRRLHEKLTLDRAHPSLAVTLARLQVDRGELKSAIDTLQRSLSYAVHQPDYQAFLAALYQRDNRSKEAVELYLLALNKSPQNGIWWMGLGISLQAQNRMQEARNAFVQAKDSNVLPPELQAFVEQRLIQIH